MRLSWGIYRKRIYRGPQARQLHAQTIRREVQRRGSRAGHVSSLPALRRKARYATSSPRSERPNSADDDAIVHLTFSPCTVLVALYLYL